MLIVKGKKYSLAGKTHRDIFYFLGNGLYIILHA